MVHTSMVYTAMVYTAMVYTAMVYTAMVHTGRDRFRLEQLAVKSKKNGPVCTGPSVEHAAPSRAPANYFFFFAGAFFAAAFFFVAFFIVDSPNQNLRLKNRIVIHI